MKKEINLSLTVTAVIVSILKIVFQYTSPILSIFVLRLAGAEIEYSLSTILPLYGLALVAFFVEAFFHAVRKELQE